MTTETETTARDIVPPREGESRQVEWEGEEHVYEPHRVGLPPLVPYFRELWRRREFAFELSRTTLRTQHFNTAFGQLWLILNPLLLAFVYFLLVDILRHGHRPPGFFAHLVAGIFAYYFFSGAVRESVKSVTGGGKLILNTAFPRVMLPLSTVITAFKRFVPTFVIYIPIHLASGLPVGLVDLWIIPIVAMIGLIASGLSMFVAALQVYFRDVKQFLPYILRIWLYASPVLYFADDVPNHWTWILAVNPLGAPLTAWSDVLHAGVSPSVTDMALGFGWGIFLFVIGAAFFMSREREFAVRL